MKRLLSLFLTGFAVVSLQAHPIDVQQARRIAAELVGDEVSLRMAAPRRQPASLSSPYYIFSRGANRGYVIVAGDDCLPAVIGYTESGDFDEQKEAPQLLSMLDRLAHGVEVLQAEGRNIPYQAPAQGAAKARANIAPLLTSHWHQSSPYNDRVPKMPDGSRALSGCVATAGAQVFYYWRKDMPTTLPATTPTYDYGDAPAKAEFQLKKGTPLQWELMCDSYGSQPAEYRNAVAVFMAAIGMQTYLTYGSSTGGYIWQLPFEMYNLYSRQADKDNGFNDDTWAALIYSDLAKGHPVVYSGYKEDWEGHAVVIDGYRAAGDFFHFNYGWGGQSDGYYTVKSIADGGMEFGMQPTVMYDIHPIRQHLDADVLLPKAVYANRVNDVDVHVVSHSSLPATGFYLFANATGKKPEKLADAIASDGTTTVAVDGSADLHFTGFSPTSTAPWHLFVTDEHLNVLTSRTVTPVASTAALSADGLRIDGNAEKEPHGSIDYTVVYHSRAAASAMVRNDGEARYEGTAQVYIHSSADEGATWQQVGRKSGKMSVAAHDEQRVAFAITSSSSTPIKQGLLYRLTLVSPLVGGDDSLHLENATDTLAYFVVRPADLEVESFDEETLKLKGHWDPTVFGNIAKKADYAKVVAYDLTAVEGVDLSITAEVAPNALYYLADDARASEPNAVKAGDCEQLSLSVGHDFGPNADIHASRAALSFDVEAGKWCLLTVPFTATVPDGLFVRSIDSHDAESIATTDVETLQSGHTYLVMAARTGKWVLEAEDTEVSAAPKSDGGVSVVGTYRNIETPEGTLEIDDSGLSLIPVVEVSPVAALRGYLPANGATRRLSLQVSALDPAYVELALSIDEARRILERYREVVGDEVYQNYLATIREAEGEFTHRAGSPLNTVAKIADYSDQLVALGAEYMRQVKDAGNIEVDFTGLVRNPSFETKNTAGWTLTTPLNTSVAASTAAGVYPISNLNFFTVGGDGNYVLNNSYNHLLEGGGYEKLGVGISQRIEGLAPGRYRMTVGVASDEGLEVTAFADDASTTVKADAFGKHYLADAIIDGIVVKPSEDGTCSLTIGIAPGDWYRADHFRLTYVGGLEEEGGEDGIAETFLPTKPTSRGIYTLQGLRVTRITEPGIYIINGRKVAVRHPQGMFTE